MELHAAQEDLDRFFSLSLDMICIAGFDGFFKRLNPAWTEIFGWTLDELLAKPYLEFVHPEDRDTTEREVGALARGPATVTFENRYRCRDGTYRWLQWKACPLVARNAIYALARDITDQKRMDREIRVLNAELQRRILEQRALNRELEAFSYSISHDLRAPLRSIDGFSRILLEEYADRLDEEARRLITVIRQGTQTMGKLIEDLLDFSRVGRKDLQIASVDMAKLARGVLAEVLAAHPEQKVETVVGTLPPAMGDPALLRQVWTNLLANAVKYSGPRDVAHIEVGGSAQETENTYYVKDDGIGFDMQYANKLFGVFQRLHASEDFQGTGIGLALVKRIVERHQGRVWAEGTLNAGATFYFALPGRSGNAEHG